MPSLAEELALAKRRGVPLCQIVTADQIATMEIVKSGLNGKSDKFPLLAWDACNGLRGLNKMGNLALIWAFLDQAKYNVERCAADGNLYNKAVLELPNVAKGRTVKLIDCLQAALGLPEHTILFAQNAQRYLKENIQGSAAVAQAILNLRNPYKGEVTMWGFSNAPEIAKSAKSRMLVLLAPELDQLPAELRQDIYVIEEKLPDQQQRKQIILACYEGGGLLKKDKKGDIVNPTKDILERAADEIKGMSAFAAEQETALSMTRDGIDLTRLRQRTIRIINQQAGLSIWEGKETFEQIGGLANVKVYLQNLVRTSPPGCVVFIDEIEKGFAGAGGVSGGGDLSGTSQGLHGEYLKWHEDNQAFGILLVGVPGTGKSMLAKATGNFADTWIFNFEIQAMKGSLVGQSTQQIRNAFRTINAFTERYPLVIATSNDASALSAELLSRFALTFFVGIPTEEELEFIWVLQRQAFGIDKGDQRPEAIQWTGREVRNCCLNAVKLGIPLIDASAFISPTILTNSKRVFELYDEAEAKAYISASYPGPFRRPESLVELMAQQEPTGRKLDLRE